LLLSQIRKIRDGVVIAVIAVAEAAEKS
jgi:hypothetical protein